MYTKLYWRDTDVLHGSESPSPDSKRKRRAIIIDGALSPPPIVELAKDSSQTTPTTPTEERAPPTDSRIKQGHLKAEKEAGVRPRKVKKHIEPGNDDCGEDISGLGKDIANYLGDTTPEDLERSDDDNVALFMPLPPRSSGARRCIQHYADAMLRCKQLR